MIRNFTKTIYTSTLIQKNTAYFAQDWSHVYDGIFRF